MKSKSLCLLAPVAGILFAQVGPALAQGTAFTYQGLLTTSNAPVNGAYDLTFTLWNALAGGAQVGNSITNPGWQVTSGQLTVPLDFGPSFSGAPLWLEIGVRTNGIGPFSTLSPRQALTPTPYAIYAESATGLANGVAIGDGVGNMIVPGTQDSFIGGGNGNNILDACMNSAIAGGMGNIVQSRSAWSFIGGGQNNQTFSAFSSIGGGGGNVITANANYSTVGGGYQNTASGLFATVGGGDGNTASGTEATVGGGTSNFANQRDATVGGGFTNTASGQYATVGGGTQNIASGPNATVAGGVQSTASGDGSTVGGGNNVASGRSATVAGGAGNVAGSDYATVAGGEVNHASGPNATVSGGFDNTASGFFAAVPGGNYNVASGYASLAAGEGSDARNDNTFVWSDGENPSYTSDRANQFKIQAGGGVVMDVSGSSGLSPAALRVNSTSANGVGLWIVTSSSDANAVFSNGGTGDIIKGFNGDNGGNPVFEVVNDGTVYSKGVVLISDRNAKGHFASIRPAEILERVASLPITQWSYNTDAGVEHIGPVAQDFHSAFGLNGTDDKHISVVDEGGVALAAIQGLNQKLEDRLQAKDAEIQDLKARLQMLEEHMIGGKGDQK